MAGLSPAFFGLSPASQFSVIDLNGNAGGPRFDGIGAVSGGGATSVLLKDYPEKQRDEILDLLFKPHFGASISALYVEVPGDGNSTQGSEPSHMHARDDENYYRGYEWWVMSEAKKRNPSISLDGCAWSCPGWIGNGDFWSQDMCDYYAKWIKGLKTYHGLTMDAIGCRNERGVSEPFIKMLRKTLNANGLNGVKVHGFDNWGANKWDWCKDLLTDPELAASVDVIGNHTMTDVGTPDSVKALSKRLNKPIWNSEEHVYKDGFDCEISIVQAFNQNYIRDAVTKITNWYLAGCVYDTEPYAEQPAMLVANSPWSGSYRVRDALWGYAHYGQFCKIGWSYLNGGCGNLPFGGSYVTLKSPGSDYSIVAETKGATQVQTVAFRPAGGLSKGDLCVWRSNSSEEFVRQPDVKAVDGVFSVELDPNSIYSFSTTRGQQKGSFEIPAAKPFPFPYRETFDHYRDPRRWGYLPHYLADIAGVFEVAERPDGKGKCLRQVVGQKPQSWAPEWTPFTVFGDSSWTDYDVSANVCLESGGWAGVMGHITNTGDGWNGIPTAIYLRLDSDGTVSLMSPIPGKNRSAGDRLAVGKVGAITPHSWHNVKLQFLGHEITGFIDRKPVVAARSLNSSRGMAGLVTGGLGDVRNTARFSDLTVKAANGPDPEPTAFSQDKHPIYR